MQLNGNDLFAWSIIRFYHPCCLCKLFPIFTKAACLSLDLTPLENTGYLCWSEIFNSNFPKLHWSFGPPGAWWCVATDIWSTCSVSGDASNAVVKHCVTKKPKTSIFSVTKENAVQTGSCCLHSGVHQSTTLQRNSSVPLLFTAGRAQCSVGTQGSTAWVWGEQRPTIQRHEPHQGRPGPFHRQLAPPQPWAGEKDCRVSARATQEPKLARKKTPRTGLSARQTGFILSQRRTNRASAKIQVLWNNQKWALCHLTSV